MNLDFSEEQKMFRAAVRDFLASECPKSKVRELEESEKGYDPELWKKIADLGWLGLILPEEYGGSGAEFTSLLVLFEEIGRNIFPSPLFSTEVLGALPILQYGNEEQKQNFLTRIARGEAIMALALIEPSASYKSSAIRVKAELQDGGYVINGTKLFVNDASVADYLSVVARTAEKADPKAGITLFLVDAKSPGIKMEVMPTIALDKQCEVAFSDVRVSQRDILGGEGGGGRW